MRPLTLQLGLGCGGNKLSSNPYAIDCLMYHTFDNELRDVSGAGNDLVADTSVTYTTGKKSGALSIGTVRKTGLSVSYDGFAISFWGKRSGTPGGTTLSMRLLGVDKIVASYVGSSTNGLSVSYEGASASGLNFGGTNTWRHYVFNVYYDGVTRPEVYKNNVLLTTLDPFSPGGSIDEVVLVPNSSAPIDELGIWERPLTTDEIAALYNSNNGYNPFA